MVRVKHRYLLLQFLFPTQRKSSPSALHTLEFHAPLPPNFTPASLHRILRDSVASIFGDYGVGLVSGLKVVYLSPATGMAIVRCPRKGYRLIWAGCTFIGELPGPSKTAGGTNDGARDSGGCVIRVMRVSGTIRKAEEEVIRSSRRDIVRMRELVEHGGAASGIQSLLGPAPLSSGGTNVAEDEELTADDSA